MKHKIGIFLLLVCISSIALSAGLVAYNIWIENTAYERAMRTARALYEQIQNRVEVTADSDNEIITELRYESGTPLINMDGEYYLGILSIPALSLKLPINSALDDDKLEASPCRYTGDFSNALVICAHNYKRHFGGIKTLSSGDDVIIMDARGYEHSYTVELVTTLHGSEVEAMVNNPYELTLFTCAKIRTDRITVRCTRVNTPTALESEIVPQPSGIAEDAPNAPKAPNFKINYKNETIKVRKGYLYSMDGVSFTEVTEAKGTLVDVSDSITNNTPVYIKKAAAGKFPVSKTQIITPLARAALDSQILPAANGKFSLDYKYEVYSPYSMKWGGMPRITANSAFEIRVKSTAKNAASLPGNLVVTYSEYEPGKSGVIAAEILAT